MLCMQEPISHRRAHTHTHHPHYVKAACHCPEEAVSRNSSFHVSSPAIGLVTRPRPACSQTQSGSCCTHHQSKDNLLPIRKKKNIKNHVTINVFLMGGRGCRAAGDVSTFKETFERHVEGEDGEDLKSYMLQT